MVILKAGSSDSEPEVESDELSELSVDSSSLFFDFFIDFRFLSLCVLDCDLKSVGEYLAGGSLCFLFITQTKELPAVVKSAARVDEPSG